MNINLGTYTIPINIIKKNNKNIYFRFNDEGILTITCNKFISEKEILKLVNQNEKSLVKMYEKFLKHKENQSSFSYLGKKYTLVFSDNIKSPYIDENMIYIKDEKMLDKWLKKECLNIFKERIKYQLPNFNNIPPFSLRIRKMKTRWGVNNITKKIITLNSELIKKDITLIDYVIVHELCHFYEANHSKNFWLQVEKRYPEYKIARKRLREE